MATILTANRSNVLVNGKALEGLQEIAFQTVKSYSDVSAIGTDERVGIVYGMTKINGTLRVRSASDELEQLLVSKGSFQIMASIKYDTPEGEGTKLITLDECQLHGKSFGLSAGGVVEVIYQFSSTREQ
ncbi:hypothetical protein E5161_07210 [Cohnella pontilimi]|uniref:Tail tube protein n=1 Tax=Cohnella pontilimi TaxID=2564100 RepID=A0A4U0FEB9_9BACL|nr:hypothetical protein [Cohnella pontilimi]TJY42634.1 hypothetical protein E5161_07210 [Cohnella pontilimi]